LIATAHAELESLMVARILVMAPIAGALFAQENVAVPAGAKLPKALQQAMREVDRNGRLTMKRGVAECK